MQIPTALVILLLIIAVPSSLAVAVYAWRHRHLAAARPLAWLMIAAAEWSVFYALEVLTSSITAKITWDKFEFLGIVAIPVAWYVFTREYAGRQPRLTFRAAVWLTLIPLITVLLAYSNEAHHLIWTEFKVVNVGEFSLLDESYGVWYWVSVAYTYILIVAGLYRVLALSARSRGIYRTQIVAVLMAGLVPGVINVLHLGGVLIIDATPFSFAISGVLLAWAIFRYRLLDLMPIAQEAMIEAMTDGMFVIDEQNRIITLNPSAEHIFAVAAAGVIGQPIDQTFPRGATLQPTHSARLELPDEITVNGLDYELCASPLNDRQGNSIGRLLTLHDITRRKQIGQRLQSQKDLLENLVAVAHATAKAATLAETLHNILEVGKSLTAAERGGLILLDASGLVVNSITEFEAQPSSAAQNQTTAHLQHNGALTWVTAHRQLLLIEDTQQDDRWVEIPGEAVPVRSVLAAPITRGANLLGVLVLSHSQPGHFSAEHAQLIQAAVDQMSLALQNAQSYEAQRHMADRQTTLYEMLHAVGGQLDPDSVARVAVEQIERLTGWRNIVVATLRADQRSIEIRGASDTLVYALGMIIEIGQGIMGRAVATRRTQCVSDVRPDVDYFEVDLETRSELAVLLRRGNRIQGVLNIESHQLAAFDTYDISLAESLADAIGLALDNAQLYREISEEHSRLQAMINSSRDGIALLSVERYFLISNARVHELLGLKGAPNDLIGRSLFEVLEEIRPTAPQAVEIIIDVARRVQATNEPSAETRLEIPPRAVQWITLPVLMNDKLLGRLLILRDVTAERELEQVRDDLTHMLVHDLRNPLSVISNAFDLLMMAQAQPLPEHQDEVITLGQQATQRVMDLVNAILEVSRFESGQMSVSREPTDLKPLIEDALQLQSVLADQKQIRLSQVLPGDLPSALIDRTLISRVIQNLVGNAIKFTPAGGAISVSVELDTTDRSSLRVAICDTGPGISPEIQGRLFQKFVTGQVRGQGSGLGLAFSRLAVEAHGGHIWVDSEIGQGTTFYFTLPVGP
jgi:two-component system, NtrC family, sensor histidine kinase KinB